MFEKVSFKYKNDVLTNKESIKKELEIIGRDLTNLEMLVSSFFSFLVRLGFDEDDILKFILVDDEEGDNFITDILTKTKDEYIGRQSEFDDWRTILEEQKKSVNGFESFKKQFNENEKFARNVFNAYLEFLQ